MNSAVAPVFHMNIKWNTGVFLAGLLMLVPAQSLSQPPVRVVCVGDSLTACGGPGGRYTDYLSAWLPSAEIINKGISGDTLGGGRKRYEQDVLALSPGIVVIELGANDFWKAKRAIEELAADLEHMVSAARRTGAQVVIASCFGDVETGDASPEFQDDIRSRYAREIARFERDIAACYGCFYVPNMQVDIKPITDHPQFWAKDRHPNKAGNEFVARRILPELEKALSAKR